jgi:hypothetical protein
MGTAARPNAGAQLIGNERDQNITAPVQLITTDTFVILRRRKMVK